MPLSSLNQSMDCLLHISFGNLFSRISRRKHLHPEKEGRKETQKEEEEAKTHSFHWEPRIPFSQSEAVTHSTTCVWSGRPGSEWKGEGEYINEKKLLWTACVHACQTHRTRERKGVYD